MNANLTGLKNLLRWKTSPHQYGEQMLKTNRVLQGLLVEANGTPDMAVDVSAGVVRQGGVTKYVALSANLALTAADATNPRIDLIVVNSSGVVAKVDGTAAASPVAPDLPADNIELARISVPANDTTIAQSQISYAERGQI